MAVASEHARPRVRGVVAAVLVLAPPAIVALLAGFDGRAGGTLASWLTALAAIATYAGQRWAHAHGRMRARDGVAEVAVTCVVVTGVLLAIAPLLAAVAGILVAAGAYARRRAADRRATGMATTGEQLAHVTRETTALIGAVRAGRPAVEIEAARVQRLAAADRLAATFDAVTSRAVVWSRLAEVLLAPVSVVAVVLVAGVALDRPWRDVLVCSLFAPLAAGGVAGLGEASRPAPPRTTEPVVRTGGVPVRALWRLRHDRVTALAAPAVRVTVLAAIAQGGALALALTVPATLRHGRHAAVWPWAAVLAALVIAHALLLARSARLAQRAGTATLRALSHEVTEKIVTTPRVRLTDARASDLATMATRGVVGASGLVVHGFRPGVGLVVVPFTAMLGGALLAFGDDGSPRLVFLLALGSWLAAYVRSAGPVTAGLRRGLDALGRLRSP